MTRVTINVAACVLLFDSSTGAGSAEEFDFDYMADYDEERRRRVSFDPSRIDDFINGLTVVFDSAPPGRYDDRAKLGAMAATTDDTGLKDFCRDWVCDGLPTRGGGRVDWSTATWTDAKVALRLTYPLPNIANQAAMALSSFSQTEHAPRHTQNWLRHRNKSGSVVDPESDSLLLKKVFTSTLSKYLLPSCRKHEMESL